jgi:hypothetical protein
MNAELATRKGTSGMASSSVLPLRVSGAIVIRINIISEISAERLAADKFRCSHGRDRPSSVSPATGSSDTGVMSSARDRHEKAALVARLDLLENSCRFRATEPVLP